MTSVCFVTGTRVNIRITFEDGAGVGAGVGTPGVGVGFYHHLTMI